MEPENETRISEFLLLELSDDKLVKIQYPLIFGLFLSMYLITMIGNLFIILATISDSHLHTPMYFFHLDLSLADICFTSTTIPKMLVNLQTQRKAITYADCITQMFFFMLFAGIDDFLLTLMTYDQFIAVCNPLHSTIIMNPWLCVLLALLSWIMSVLNSLLISLMALCLSFCPPLEIPHFFCELNQVIYLASPDTFLNNMVIYSASVLLGGGPLTGILYSYCKIVSYIHAISSAQGKYKAFSTYASHLLDVSLFCFTMISVYFSSAMTQTSHSSAIASVMYTVVTPMLNPFIYSLRNKDIKRALRSFFWKETINE